MTKHLAAVLGTLLVSTAAFAQEVAVDADNRSVPTLCAEEDNVDLRLSSSEVRSFRVEARHPEYLSSVTDDVTAPDFTNCPSPPPPTGQTFTPARRVLGSGPEWEIVGITYPSFWRDPVPVWIGDQRFDDVHLIQFWSRSVPAPEEVLVLYPADGYWRARPRAPMGRTGPPDAPATAYGSSFLVGPVENGERPFVALDKVTIDPKTATAVLDLARGGHATVRIAELDDHHIAVNARLDPAVNGLPFAGLRAMFVTDTNADASEVRWQDPDGRIRRQPILAFPGGPVVWLTAARSTPGRHNTSAPDVTFSGFSTEPR